MSQKHNGADQDLSTFRRLLEESPDAVITTSETGEVLSWNGGAETIFGFTRQEAIGRRLGALITPDDRAEEHSRLLRQVITAGSATVEVTRRRKDGSIIYVDVTGKAMRDAQDRVEFLLFNKKDVTQLKALRDARMLDARFRDLIESTPDAIVMVNPSGRIVLANTHASRLFGYAAGDLLGQSVEALLPGRFRNAHVGHRAGYFSHPRVRSMGVGLELFGLRKDGTEFPVEISLSPLGMGEDALVMSAIRDISERKRFERTLQEKNIELVRANAAKDRFLATMSHELRTPLNAIIGFTGTLLMKLPGPLTEEQERQLRTVQTSARHLLGLINDLLDVAKIEAGKIELVPEPVVCQDVLREIERTLRPQAEQKGLAFRLVMPEENVHLEVDRRALSQIVLNLAMNAIKFTETGSVCLALAVQERPQRIAISLADTGVGIKHEDQSRLFQAFTQLGKPRYEGTGLGLNLSQRLAQLLGGQIRCKSEPGRGSEFTLELPGT